MRADKHGPVVVGADRQGSVVLGADKYGPVVGSAITGADKYGPVVGFYSTSIASQAFPNVQQPQWSLSNMSPMNDDGVRQSGFSPYRSESQQPPLMVPEKEDSTDS